MTMAGTAGELPFVATPVGDLAAATAAATRATETLDLPTPVLLRAGMNALYRSGDVVLRVGHTTADPGLAVELAGRLLDAGIPVARPASSAVTVVEGLAVTAWELLDVRPEPIDWPAVGRIVRAVHGLRPEDLPAGYPLPSPSALPWWDFDRMIADVADLIDAEALAGLTAAVERHRGWSEMSTVVVCHGDVHPGNVVTTPAGPVLLDWDLMCTAAPAWDHAMLLTLERRWGGEPGTYAAFAEGYGRSFAHDPEALAFAELRNVAATLLRLRAGRGDPAAAEEAARRLRYWRGEPGAPMWRAQ